MRAFLKTLNSLVMLPDYFLLIQCFRCITKSADGYMTGEVVLLPGTTAAQTSPSTETTATAEETTVKQGLTIGIK